MPHVSILDSHIVDGCPDSSRDNMVALAIQDCFPNHSVSVGVYTGSIYDLRSYRKFKLPEFVSELIQDRRRGVEINPFEFDLEMEDTQY